VAGERIAAFLAASEKKVRRELDGVARYVDVRSFVTRALSGRRRAANGASRRLRGGRGARRGDVKILGSGGVKTTGKYRSDRRNRGASAPAIRAAPYADRAGIEVEPLDSRGASSPARGRSIRPRSI